MDMKLVTTTDFGALRAQYSVQCTVRSVQLTVQFTIYILVQNSHVGCPGTHWVATSHREEDKNLLHIYSNILTEVVRRKKTIGKSVILLV